MGALRAVTVPDVYAYGMTVLSTIHELEGPYPERDTYQEIRKTFRCPGGEAGNAAIVLSRWGLKVKLGGPHLGRQTRGPLTEAFGRSGVDVSGLRYDSDFDGWEDMVLVDDSSRTVFGHFRGLLFDGSARWSEPDEKTIKSSRWALVDPFFGNSSLTAAALCGESQKSYVVIDCAPDSAEHRGAAAIVVSREYLEREYPEEKPESLFERYRAKSRGLTVFTFGVQDLWYARPKGAVRTFTPYRVETRGTLGAGDTFRAGILYGLFMGWGDEDTVKFAAAAAACACRRQPVALDPPSLEEVLALRDVSGA